jgi:hypothetical protein
MANKDSSGSDDQARDDRTRHQQEDPAQGRRPGIPGKGFDAGTGYGGAGNESQYSSESSWGGQSGTGGSTMHGGYSGSGNYGREGEGEDAGPDAANRRNDADDESTANGA